MASNLTDADIRSIADEESLQLVKDPFFASKGYEFRRRSESGFECLGLLQTLTECTIYRRHLTSAYVLFRERLWWLSPLLRKKSVEDGLITLSQIKLDDLDRQLLVQMIKKNLPSGNDR